MSNTTDKTTILDFTVGQDSWGPDVNDDLHRFDAWARTDWAFDPINSSALGYHYTGGVIFSGGAYSKVANGSVILGDNMVNYVERTTAGVVSRNATGFTVGSIPMAKVTTAGGLITVNEDWRGVDVSTAIGGPPTGAAGGDLTGTYPNPTLAATAVTAGSYGDGTHVAAVTVDAKGRLTAVSSVTITGAAPTGSAGGDLTGTFPNPTIKASVGLTGAPTAPTASYGTNTTQIASTAMVQAAVATKVADGNSSTAQTIDWTTGNIHTSTLTGNCTYTFTAPSPALGVLILVVTQDATGSRTVTWPAAVKWSGGTAPTLTTTANKTDIFTFYYDGTNYFGVTSGLNY